MKKATQSMVKTFGYSNRAVIGRSVMTGVLGLSAAVGLTPVLWAQEEGGTTVEGLEVVQEVGETVTLSIELGESGVLRSTQDGQPVQETQTTASAFVIGNALQEGEETAPKGMIVMSSESVDGGAPVISSFSLAAPGMGPGAGGFSFGAAGGPDMNFKLGSELNFGGMPFVDTSDWGNLLNIPSIREELDVMDAQFSEITKARQEMQKSIKEQINQIMEGGFDPSKAKEMAEMIRKQRESAETAVREQLLPGQVQRLREVALRLKQKQVGTVGLLAEKDVKEALGIDSEQLTSLKAKAKELEEEMQKRIEALRKKAQEELIRELKPEQQEKLKKMLGKEFDANSVQAPKPALKRVIQSAKGETSQEEKSSKEDR